MIKWIALAGIGLVAILYQKKVPPFGLTPEENTEVEKVIAHAKAHDPLAYANLVKLYTA